MTSYYGVFTIEFPLTKPNHIEHQLQTDDIDIEFSKVFTDYVRKIQIIYSYLSIIELRKTQDDSPTQTSRLTAVRQKIFFLSKF